MGIYCWNTSHNIRNEQSIGMVVGAFNLLLASAVFDPISRCLGRTTRSKKLIAFVKNCLFYYLSRTSALRRRVSTVQT